MSVGGRSDSTRRGDDALLSRARAVISERVDEACVVLDAAGTVRWWNRGAEDLFRAAEMTVGVPYGSVWEGAASGWWTQIRSALEEEGSWTGVLRLPAKEGGEAARVRVQIFPVEDHGLQGAVALHRMDVPAFGAPRPFGEQAVELYRQRGLSEEAIQACLADQRKKQEAGEPVPPLGQLLAARGYLASEEIDVIRRTQEKDRTSQMVAEHGRHLLASSRDRFGDLVGGSPKMQIVYQLVERVAPSDVNVFIQGKTGTGKELVARAVHRHSDRAHKPFIPVNMAGLQRELLSSALFGHVKGAFTGADRARTGAFEQADGGTLFLDEITELDLDLQAKLLRVVDDGEVQPLGAQNPRRVSVRLISATNRSPQEAIRNGELREDLYYRLTVVPIELPSLRERKDDVVRLAEDFLQRAAKRHGRAFRTIAPEARARLQQHTWPGNVRELQHIIEQVVVVHDGPELRADMLPETIGAARTAERAASSGAAREDAAPKRLEDAERQAIVEALNRCNQSATDAASELGISVATLYRRLKKHEIPRPSQARRKS